ncbi:MBL fold metallo-hydrolase [Bacillus cereus]
MEFVAIPVKMGDSFLLKDGNFNLLVDGGDGKTKIIREVSKYTEHLDVVICTHYDSDHIKGLLDLFEDMISKRMLVSMYLAFGMEWTWDILKHFLFKIDEIWLPDIFGRIKLFKDKEIREMREREKYLREGKLVEKRQEEQQEEPVGIIFSGNKVYLVDGEKREFLAEREYFDTPIHNIRRLVIRCNLLVKYYGVKIRWFSFTNAFENKLVDTEKNIYGINCEEITRKIEPYGSEEQVLFNFTRINRESLVYRYNKAEVGSSIPNVLFTADSSFEFIPKPRKGEERINYQLLNNGVSIVTTPHHGSPDDKHKYVYQNLEGNDFIFVRSSERHDSRPCKEYKDHPNEKRYCTRCRIEGDDEQTVRLRFKGGKWEAYKGVEICTCE